MLENQITTQASALFGVVDAINQFLVNYGVPPGLASWMDEIISVGLLFLISFVADLIGRYVIHRIIGRLAKFTKTNLDDIMMEKHVFRYLIHILPSIIFYLCIPIAINSALWVTIFKKATIIYIIIQIIRAIKAAGNAMEEFYAQTESYSQKPVKVMFQVVTVIAYFVGGISILSILINTSLTTLFASLGAFAAVLMLIFKDSILGFVAGWQLSSNDMLRKGDWITVPKFGADGNVEEISLYSVKVRNFDNTITTIPPYSLVSDSFQNWRGMQESGGRRIKRSISIDMSSVCFCTPEMIEKFRKIKYLTNYIESTEKALDEYNLQNNVDNSILVNGRRQTNIGVYRAYLQAYLDNHPDVNHSLSCMVRQLQSTEKGIPIELYFFTTLKDWTFYENVQSDIFDHIMAITEQFGLRIFQYRAV